MSAFDQQGQGMPFTIVDGPHRILTTSVMPSGAFTLGVIRKDTEPLFERSLAARPVGPSVPQDGKLLDLFRLLQNSD